MLRKFFDSSRIRNDGGVSPEGPKLNLGCGFDYREGYINVDLHHSHRVDLVCDVTWLKDIEDQSCSEAVAQDVLEHLPRAKVSTALREWNRVLKNDGRLMLRVPSLLDLLKLLAAKENQTYEQQTRLIHFLYGTQGYEGDFHLSGFTKLTLIRELEEAGFEVISVHIQHDWLLDVVARKVRHVSPAPLLRAATDAEFLEAAYPALLHRDIDPGGKDYYLQILASGIARETVMDILRESDEYRRASEGLLTAQP